MRLSNRHGNRIYSNNNNNNNTSDELKKIVYKVPSPKIKKVAENSFIACVNVAFTMRA